LTHDLAQITGYLRSALEQDKKPVGFLIGAGAPMSLKPGGVPLIPGLEDLTKEVREQLEDTDARAFEKLLTQLPGNESNNLESILNYVRALAALPGSEDVRGIPMATFASLDHAICKIVRAQVDKDLPDEENAYLALALWIGAVRRISPTQLFTTNYDLLLEQALERQRITYFDGFMGSRKPAFELQAIEEDLLPSRWSLLWKLHGSINWTQDEKGNVSRQAPNAENDSSALIYPSNLKYDQSRRLPYLAMMDRLKTFLGKPGAVLIGVGFSFRDQHINEVIEQSLRANPTASVQALLHGDLGGYDDAVALTRRLTNLVLIARDAAVVGSVQATWTPLIEGDSHRETAVTCDLGDFERLGELLREITGQAQARDENADS
jgi:hypothetical protein